VITSELVTRSPDSCATISDTSTDSTSASRQSTPVKDLIRRFSVNELGSPIFQKYKPGPSGTTRPYIQPSKVSPPPQQHTHTEIAQPPTVLSPPDIKLEDAPALPTPRVQAIPGSWSPGANIKFGDIETIIPAHAHAGDTDIDIPDAPPQPVKGKKPPLLLSNSSGTAPKLSISNRTRPKILYWLDGRGLDNGSPNLKLGRGHSRDRTKRENTPSHVLCSPHPEILSPVPSPSVSPHSRLPRHDHPPRHFKPRLTTPRHPANNSSQ
jgi:hypothetical protein